jgi:hypothetical protein
MDEHRRRLPRDLLQRGPAAAGLGRPQRAGEEDRQSLESAGKVGEKPKRRDVAPVEVVDRQQRGFVPDDVGGKPVETMQRGERCRGLIISDLVGRGEHPCRPCSRPRQQSPSVGRIGQ